MFRLPFVPTDLLLALLPALRSRLALPPYSTDRPVQSVDRWPLPLPPGRDPVAVPVAARGVKQEHRLSFPLRWLDAVISVPVWDATARPACPQVRPRFGVRVGVCAESVRDRRANRRLRHRKTYAAEHRTGI